MSLHTTNKIFIGLYKNTPQLALFFFLLQQTPPTYSGELFINDTLPIPIYKTPNNKQSAVIDSIPSGEEIILIEEPEHSAWTKVKTPTGKEGWIKKEYLTTSKSNQQKLKESEQKITAIQSELLEKTHRIHSLQQEIVQMKEKILEREDIKKNPSLPSNSQEALHPLADNPYIKNRLNHGETEATYKQLEINKINNEDLKIENTVLRENQYTQGMIHGTIAVLFGALLSMILPRLKPKKRNEHWE